jgi:ribosome-associated protein
MDIRKLQRAIVNGLEDVKAHDIVVFNTEALSPLFERVIIASGTSNRQTKALAASVREAVKAAGAPVPRTEGQDNGEWIIVDCGAAVAHIMQPAIRDYYRLEEIWGVKPVTMKSLSKPGRQGLPKAETPRAAKAKAAVRAAAAKPAAVTVKKAAGGGARRPGGATVKRTGGTPAKKPVAPAARKAAPARRGKATGTAGAKRAAGKPARARTPKA